MFFLPFSKTANCTWQPQWTHAILLHFKKNYLRLFTANCTQNHVITYAYLLKLLAKLALILNTHTQYMQNKLTYSHWPKYITWANKQWSNALDLLSKELITYIITSKTHFLKLNYNTAPCHFRNLDKLWCCQPFWAT